MRTAFLGAILTSRLLLAQAPPQPADLVIQHGVVLTVDGSDSIAQAVAVRDGRILSVGSDAGVGRLIGPKTRVIDLAGHTLTPGLIDTHAHLLSSGIDELLRLDLTQTASIAELLAKVRAQAQSKPPGGWIDGFGWNQGILAEHRGPTLAELDAAASGHPLILENVTHHYAMIDTAAMKLAHIEQSSEDPPGGTYERGLDGQLTGGLNERSAINPVQALVPPFSLDQYRAVLRTMMGKLHAEGMTGVKDLVYPNEWAAYTDFAKTGGLTIHSCDLFWAGSTMESGTAALTEIRKAQAQTAAHPQGDLQVCGAKILLDGAAGGRTAWRYEDYAVDTRHPAPTGKGFPTVDPEIYRSMVLMFNAAGVSIGTHAIGDRAIDLALDSYAQALREHPSVGLRHSVIHATEPTEHALQLMTDLQKRYDAGIPETQAEFLWWLGDSLPAAFGPERSLHIMPLATYRKRGILFTSGSDYGVTPLAARFGLWATVAREPLKGVFGKHPFGTEEAVDVHVALKSYTLWAARQIFQEKQTGSIEIGKWADLAVWDRNPYTVPTAALKDMQCLMTLYKGKIVFEH